MADFKKTVSVKGAMKEHVWGGEYQEYIEIYKHDAIENGLHPCNYFSFLLPEELADKCVIPEYAGLYTYRVDNAGYSRVVERKTAPLLHKGKISENKKYEVARKMAYKYWHK